MTNFELLRTRARQIPTTGVRAATLAVLFLAFSIACDDPPPSTNTPDVPTSTTVNTIETPTTIPEPTQTPATNTPTAASTPSPTPQPIVVATTSPTSTAVIQPLPTAAATPTTVPTPLPTPVPTPIPTATPSPTPTQVPVPLVPTVEPTPVPTNTPAPTQAPTATPPPTATPSPTVPPTPSDSTPPTVNSSSITDTIIDIGESFSVDYSVSDNGGADLLVVELFRAPDVSGSPGTWEQVGQSLATGASSSGVVTDSPKSTGSYHYRIEVFDNAVNSSIGSSIGPVIVEPLVLPATTLTAPANGATGVTTLPTLSWNAVPNAEKYWVTFAAAEADLPTDQSAEDCTECLVSVVTTDTSYTPSIDLENGTTYYWRVQAFQDSGETPKQGVFTSTSSFSTIVINVTLTLYVHDGAGGTVLSGVQVTGTDALGTAFSETTDGTGKVTITGAAGSWSFTATKSGYTDRSWSQDIEVTGDVHTFM